MKVATFICKTLSRNLEDINIGDNYWQRIFNKLWLAYIECIQVEKLMQTNILVRGYFQQSSKTQTSLFVEGIVKGTTKLLSLDNKVNGIFIKTPTTSQGTEKFSLIQNQNIFPNSQLDVYDFSNVQILPGVLTKIQKNEVLTEGTKVCIFGHIIYGQKQKSCFVIEPVYLAKTRQQIIKYLKIRRITQIIFGIIVTSSIILVCIKLLIKLKHKFSRGRFQQEDQIQK